MNVTYNTVLNYRNNCGDSTNHRISVVGYSFYISVNTFMTITTNPWRLLYFPLLFSLWNESMESTRWVCGSILSQVITNT